MENCLPWEAPHTGPREEYEEEEATETTCDEQTVTPIPRPPKLFGWEEVEKSGVKLSLGRREGWWEGVLLFGFYSSLSYSDFDW